MAWIGRAFKIISFKPKHHGEGAFHYTRWPRAPSNLVLNSSRDGTFTISLGNLFQCLSAFTVKNFFSITNLDLLSFSLKPFHLVLSLFIDPCKNSHFRLLSSTGRTYLSHPEALSFQAEESQLSQHFLIQDVIHPSNYLDGPHLESLRAVRTGPSCAGDTRAWCTTAGGVFTRPCY